MRLEDLNDSQKRAVKYTDGALLIIAGAGSGKTRVLTNRIAYLIEECGVDPYNIMAITFTNKAAREMKERVETTVAQGAGADRNLRDLQTVQDNKIRTVQDLSSRLDELNQMTDSIRRELRAIQSSREDSETENVISEYLSIQSAFANAAVPIEMEGKFENRLDEIEENYPIEELIHQKESNSKKEKQLQKEIKNLQQASRRLSKLKKIQKR